MAFKQISMLRKRARITLTVIILLILILSSGCTTSSQPPATLLTLTHTRRPIPAEVTSPLPTPTRPTHSETVNPYQATTQPIITTTEPVVTTTDHWQVKIDYSGSWQGALEYGTTVKSISGTGSKIFEITDPGNAVSVSAQKLDDSINQISVQILKNGQVIASENTESPWGSAQTIIAT